VDAAWTESHTVTVADGFYAVALGESVPLDHTVLDGGARWLGVTLGGVEGPRQRLGSVPYAVTAGLPVVSCPDGTVLTGFDGTGPVCLVLLPGTNLLANASFESTWATGADRAAASSWFVSGSITTNQSDTGIPSAGARSLRIAGAGFAYQPVDAWADLRGRTLTLSVDVLPTASAAGAAISVDDGVSVSTASAAAGSGAWERLTVVHAVAANASRVAVRLHAGANATRFDAATLVVADLGAAAAPFFPTRPADDALHALRWYETGRLQFETSDNYDDDHAGSGPVINFRVPKAATPTVSFLDGHYKCMAYDGSGTPAAGTLSTPGALWVLTPTCTALHCAYTSELQGAGQAKRCIMRWDWVASADDPTY
jgi:hypothetical protein